MSSDLSSDSDSEESQSKKAPAQILKSELREGMDAIARPFNRLFMSGLSAGLDVGFSVLMMGVMMTAAAGKLPPPVVKILIANMYSVGFIFVVLGRSELFTEQTTLAVLPVLNGRATISTLLKLWVTVYLSNILGAILIAGLVSKVMPALGGVTPEAFGEIGRQVVNHPFGVIFMSAVLAGWLMGLLSWLVAAVRDTISAIAVVWLITTCIGFAKLHHVILGTVEVMTGVFSKQGITSAEFFRFLAAATLGNTVGGSVFVAILKYGHARPEGDDGTHEKADKPR